MLWDYVKLQIISKKTLSEMKVAPPNKLLTVTLLTLPVNCASTEISDFLGFGGKKWNTLSCSGLNTPWTLHDY